MLKGRKRRCSRWSRSNHNPAGPPGRHGSGSRRRREALHGRLLPAPGPGPTSNVSPGTQEAQRSTQEPADVLNVFPAEEARRSARTRRSRPGFGLNRMSLAVQSTMTRRTRARNGARDEGRARRPTRSRVQEQRDAALHRTGPCTGTPSFAYTSRTDLMGPMGVDTSRSQSSPCRSQSPPSSRISVPVSASNTCPAEQDAGGGKVNRSRRMFHHRGWGRRPPGFGEEQRRGTTAIGSLGRSGRRSAAAR